jgi:hypothetical protein
MMANICHITLLGSRRHTRWAPIFSKFHFICDLFTQLFTMVLSSQARVSLFLMAGRNRRWDIRS